MIRGRNTPKFVYFSNNVPEAHQLFRHYYFALEKSPSLFTYLYNINKRYKNNKRSTKHRSRIKEPYFSHERQIGSTQNIE